MFSTLKPALRVDWKRLRFVALCVFCFGLFCHGYAFLNTNFSHDSLYSIYEKGPGLMLSVGRYGRVVYRLLRGNFCLPLLNGFLSLCYLTLSSYLLTDMLSIRSRGFLLLTCGVLVGNSTVALTNATYLHDADAYSLALLLAVTGAWLQLRWKQGWLFSIVFYAASLSIYQAYINVAVYLWLFLSLMELLDGRKPRQVLGTLVLRMLCIAAAMVLYYLGHLLIIRITGLSVNSYSNIGSFSLSLSALLSCAREILNAEQEWFFQCLGIHGSLLVFINLALTAMSFLALGSLAVKMKLPPTGWMLGLLILLLMPLGMDAVALISDSYHEITLYALFLTYPLMLSLLERYLAVTEKPFRGMLCSLLLAAMLFDSALYSNTLYLKKQLECQRTLSVYTRIADRMEHTEGYVPGQTPIVLVGVRPTALQTKQAGFDYRGAGLKYSYAVTYYDTMQDFFHYYLGYPAVFGDDAIRRKVSRMEEMHRMPAFPAPGAIRMIDGIMIVKLRQPASGS